MADPFSIISSAIGIADVLFRLGRYLKDVYEDAAVVDDYILGLLNEAEQLRTIISSIEEVFKAQSNTSTYKTASDTDSVTNLWEQLGKSLNSCLGGVQEMDIVVRDICGKNNGTGMLDNLAKAHRKRSKADSLCQCRNQLATYQRSLQMVLATIILYNIRYCCCNF
jgi:conjugal transfer/entry exclusion protein